MKTGKLVLFLFVSIYLSALIFAKGTTQAARPMADGAQPNVLTQHNNVGRTGANLNETALNVANVNGRQFGKLFTRAVDGYIYAQPLYVSQLGFPDQSTHNVVYVATEHNSVYAFDADDAEASDPLWQVNLGASVPSTDISATYRDLMPEIGITGTPVIDLPNQTLYLVAKSKDAADNSYHQKLHALDLTTGQNKPGSPVEITGSVQGTGAGSVNGTLTFDPFYHLNRPGLLLLNGVVYIGFGSHANIGPHHGWLFGYDGATLQRVALFNTTPDAIGGSIWMSGQGLLADEDSNIYLTTGNGTYSVRNGGRDYGNTALKLGTANGLSVIDSFTPKNEDVLDAIDADLGSGGPLLLPGFNRLTFTGKDTVLRVLDTKNLGGFDSLTDHIVQQFQPSPRRLFGGPAYWKGPAYGPSIYYWAGGDNLKVFKLINGKFQDYEAALSPVINVTGISNAAPMSLSANGSKAGSGILWATGSLEGDANRRTVPGILYAFDASDVTKKLWDSQQNADRDAIGNFAKFCPPTVANGKVYAPTFSGQLQVYGLLPGVCNFNLSQNSQLATSDAESGNVNLAVENDCNWLANSNDSWINIISGGEGTGSGLISYLIEPNPGGLVRTGTISIAGLDYTIRQAGTVAAASAASYSASPLASHSIAVAIGSGLASGTESAGNTLPTSLAGTRLTVTDSKGLERLAPLFYVSPEQINYQIPPGTETGPALITVSSADGNIATTAIQIETIAPGLFSANATGQGVAAAVALRVKADGSQIFEPISQLDATGQQFVVRPIDLGLDQGQSSDQVFLILFGTGIRHRNRLGVAEALIGNTSVKVAFAGDQGTFAGLDQVNLLLPRSLIGKGELDLLLKIDGKTTNAVKISIK